MQNLSADQQKEMDFIVRQFDRDHPVFRDHYDELELGYDYLAGIQHTKKQKQWYETQRRPTRTFNLILPSFNITLGDFLLNELNVKVAPQPGGTAQLASTFQDLIDHVNIENDIRSVFQDTALAGLVKCGFLHIRFSDEKYPDGSIVIDNTDEFEIMWERPAQHYLLDDSEWIIRSAWKDKNEIMAFFPQHRRELNDMLAEKEHLPMHSLTAIAHAALYNRDYVNERDGKYRIIEFHRMQWEQMEVFYDFKTGTSMIWDLEGAKADLMRRRYPNGKIIMRRARKKTITEIIPGLWFWLNKRDADVQDQQHDYIPFSAFSYGRTTLGNFGVFRNAKDPQDDLNSWRNMLNAIIGKIVNPGHIYKPEHFENPDHLEAFINAPGVMIKADTTLPINEIIQSLAEHLTKLPFAPDTLSKEAAEFLQRIVNVTESLYGVQESATEPASLYAQKVRRALIAFQSMYYNWSRTKRRLYSKVVSHIQTNYTTQRYFMVQKPQTGEMREIMLNYQIGDQVLNDVTVGRYQVTTDDIDKHPTAKFARFRQKTEVVTLVMQMFGGAIANPAAIVLLLQWWLSDSELGDIDQFISGFAQALGQQDAQMQEAVQQQEAVGLTGAMLEMASKELEMTTGGNGLSQQGPNTPQQKPGFSHNKGPQQSRSK